MRREDGVCVSAHDVLRGVKMKKGKKRFLLVLSAILLLTAVVMPVTAANKKNAGRHISMCSNGTCSLRIKGNHAAADCHVINKGADKMTVTMDLLKYKNGTWKKVQSCGKTTRKSRVSLSGRKLILPGRYRAKVTVVAVRGNCKKTTSYYSMVAIKK